MALTKKRLIISSILILIVAWVGFQIYDFLKFGFGAGSYPHAEVYHLNASEGEVIAAIRELEKENKLYKPPGVDDNISVRDTSNHQDYWRFTNFYFRDSKEVVQAWTRPDDSTSTTFAFYGVDYKVINQDLWYIPNALKIRKFRKEIFEPLEARLAERKKAGL
jgi:hypothetical protein